MPRIPDDRLDVAVYFYPTIEEARKGSQAGGTGFVFSYPLKSIPDTYIACIITNKHVIQKAPVARLNRKDGQKPDCVLVEENQWFPHRGPHDLAVAFGAMHTTEHKYNPIPSSICLTPEKMEEYKIGIGDDIYMIGRFIGHEGKVHNEATARFGHLSAVNRSMFNTETGLDEDSFAVEMKSKPGYSGSPAITYACPFTRVFNHARPLDKLSFEFLLGILWGQIVEKRPLREEAGKEIKGPYVTEMSGLSGVIPAWHLLTLMEQTEVQEMIASVEADELRCRADARTTTEPMVSMLTDRGGDDDHADDHNERFNRLLDAVVNRPKSSGQT